MFGEIWFGGIWVIGAHKLCILVNGPQHFISSLKRQYLDNARQHVLQNYQSQFAEIMAFPTAWPFWGLLPPFPKFNQFIAVTNARLSAPWNVIVWLRVGHGSILLNPIQPNPLADWLNPIQSTLTMSNSDLHPIHCTPQWRKHCQLQYKKNVFVIDLICAVNKVTYYKQKPQ